MLKKLTQETYRYLLVAENFFSRKFSLDEVRCDIRGKTAGYYRLNRVGQTLINYNPAIYSANVQDFLSRTVPHEVAHLVSYQRYGNKIKPHGKEWQTVMKLFGADATRCHDYDVSAIKSRIYRRFQYQCECSHHQLTAIRHHRVIAGQKYLCRKCRQPLSFVS